MTTTTPFSTLGLAPTLISALTALGYESPTPIQEKSIPILLQGKDLLAQAQTGTGKTAAFALPTLSKIDVTSQATQTLVIAPTRELAIQVAEAFQSYAKHTKGFRVTPIYGGQEYSTQLRALRRGSHVVVGTPGRLMDHLRKGTLKVDQLKTIVLDEADEMLKMGFIEDIEWILEQIPAVHQTALFSATMPPSIQKIAKRYLKNAEKVEIQPTEKTVDAIEQFYTSVSRNQKLEVLTRFLEVEKTQGVIVFTRTKNNSSELAEKLQARGYAASALNGDMSQDARKKVVERIKNASLDIVVATDVAARGIDVPRLSHVINYDIPCDAESYIHRIGRTGRAGRKGTALLFVTPREFRLLKDIERAIGKPIEQLNPPSLKQMGQIRTKQLVEKIINLIKQGDKLKPCHAIVTDIISQTEYKPEDIAAALVALIEEANPRASNEIQHAEPEEPRGGGRRRQPSRFGGRPSDEGRDRQRTRRPSRQDDSKRRKPIKRK